MKFTRKLAKYGQALLFPLTRLEKGWLGLSPEEREVEVTVQVDGEITIRKADPLKPLRETFKEEIKEASTPYTKNKKESVSELGREETETLQRQQETNASFTPETNAKFELESEVKADVAYSRYSRSAPVLMTNAKVEELKLNPAYSGIDVTKEAFKFSEWCKANQKRTTVRRFIVWLNRL